MTWKHLVINRKVFACYLQQSTPNQKKRREFNKKPKTTSPKMKTAKKMKNVQSQAKIKLHQLIRRILARYLYNSLDPLQQ